MREKFHTLDALRFFSFFFVFMSHLPYTLFPKLDFLKTKGDIGVYFFFTLSGFLITYIITLEKKEKGNFDFKKYFIRRILRIWPLYYLTLIFAFFTPYILSLIGLGFTNVGYEPNWLFSGLFLENYMIMYHNDFANVSPLPVLWSLCIEEHFYILWGTILFFTKTNKIPYWIILIIIISNISRLFFYQNNLLFKDILTNFDYFMYGATPAYLYVNHKEKTLNFIKKVPDAYKKIILLIAVVYPLTSNHLYFHYKQLIDPIILGPFFSMVIFILLPKENKHKITDSNIFSRLGVYTYGLYIFHAITINLAIHLYQKSGIQLSEINLFLVIFTFSIVSVTLVSFGSYHLYEKPFLKLKSKF